MKAGFIGASAEEHAGNGAVALIGQDLQLIFDGDAEQLTVVQQHAAQEFSRLGPQLERRVQATAGLAVASPSAGNHRRGPPGLLHENTPNGSPGGEGVVREVEGDLGRERLLKGGRVGRREGGDVAWETTVHQQEASVTVGGKMGSVKF